MTGNFAKPLTALDDVDLPGLLQQFFFLFIVFFLQRPPRFRRTRIRQALTFALISIITARTPAHSIRAWTLWLLLPMHAATQTLWHQNPPQGRLAPPRANFQEGQWAHLLRQARPDQATVAPATSGAEPSLENRANRARHFVQRGDLSAARHTTNLRRVARSQPRLPAPYGTMFGKYC